MTIAICVPAILALSTRIGTADLAYHVRAGHEILDLGTIPRVDSFTFTVAGQPWFDQQWGSQLLLALIDAAGGWHAQALVRAGLVALTFAMVFFACRARGARSPVAAGLTLAGFVVAAVNLSMRPQLLALPLFAASLLIWASRSRYPRAMWAIPLFAAVTANLHGSFVLFPILPFLAWAADRESHAEGRRALRVTLATTIATFITPFGPRVWLYATDLSTSPLIRRTIEEWQPPALTEPTGALLYASIFGTVVLLSRRRPPAPALDLFMLGLFAVPAFVAVRGLLWWGLVAPVVIAGLVRSHRARSEDDNGDRGPAAIAVVGLALVTLALAVSAGTRDLDELLRDAPTGVTEAVAELPTGTRLLAHQPWASWFTHSVPHVPLFADSRIELFPDSIWSDYSEVAFAGADWAEVLDSRRIEAIAAPSQWPLIPLLRSQDGWRVAYEGDDGMLFVRA